MRLGERGEAGDDRVPRLTPGCDPTSLELTPTEGYLLSRVDGHTSFQALRQMGGLPPHEVDRCLERWLESGVLEVDDGGSAEAPPEVEKPEPRASRSAGAPLRVDPELELDVEIQQQVIDFLARLDRPYHEVLGVARDADARTLKKAYFGLSRLYHPDRYFRRRLGPFGPAVERCFKRLLEAYELLSDPATREEVQRGERQRQQEAATAARTDEATRRRLRKRLDQLSGQGRLRAERRRKAKGFFEAGMAAFAKERWLEAAGSVRLSIAFDPENAAFRERFAEVQRRAHEERAKQLVRQAEGALDMRDFRDALALFEDAIHYRPYDAELCAKAARIAWQAMGDLRKAKDLAAAACELEPDNAAYRRVLGQVYAAAGLESNARRELKAAVKLDPGDKEARSALKAL